MNIYYDNAATTPILPPPDSHDILGNPSSPHALGIDAERKLTNAREAISKILSCSPSEVIFTSGGTESNNLALLGFAMANRRNNFTFICQPWEHPSVIEPLKAIKEQGLGSVMLAPQKEWNSCKSLHRFVAISHVNHETGDINDITRIAANLKNSNSNTIIFLDNAQGFCKEDTNLSDIDLLSFSAHKFHGPTGVGGLMLRNKIRLKPLLYGGSQERNLRPGTENISGIIHTANSAMLIWHQKNENYLHVGRIKQKLMELALELPNITINSQTSNTSPYILNMSFLGLKGETIVHALSEKGVSVSMGAACQSRKKTKSTLETMGFSQEIASSSIRFSFSHLNTLEEAVAAKEIIANCIYHLRKILNC